MQIEIFSLCEGATTNTKNLNILEAFDTLWTDKVPFIFPQCTIAIRARFNQSEGEEHKVSVKFIDNDGNHVIPATNGVIRIDFSNKACSAVANLVFNVQRIKIPAIGEYAINLNIDGKNKATLPVFVRKRIKKK
jgi:hypothetical protein